MRTPSVVAPDEEVRVLGHFCRTPIVVKGITWLPLVAGLVWGATAWVAGKRRSERGWPARLAVGALMMPLALGSEWIHNFAHALAAWLVDRPMDALRITWGTPLVVYYDTSDPTVTPRQHLVRALGGPLVNVALLILSLLVRRRTSPGSLARELADTAAASNGFLCTVGMMPAPTIDGGPILKWSLVARGRSVEEADRVVQRVNAVMGAGLSLAAVGALRQGRRLWGAFLGAFGVSMLAFGLGLLRER